MTVPFLDLLAGYEELRPEIDDAIARTLESGIYIGGPEVEAFETEFAAYTQAEHCVAVGNGLDALTLALRASGVGDGDEVIVPAHTFIATWLSVSSLRAIVVPVEPCPETMNIDPDRVETAITEKTKAIVPVHLYGQPASIESIREVAGRYGVCVLEDAAQAHGAVSDGVRIGSQGHAVAWSFYPGKNLGAFGDGGAITTNDRRLADNVRKLRNYGSQRKYEHELSGVNSRLDPIQAAVLRVKLRFLDEWNERRAKVADSYLKGLVDLPLTLPVVRSGCEPVWHLFAVRHSGRDGFVDRLRQEGVQTLVHYPTPCHKQTAFSGRCWPRLPVTEKMCRSLVSLPIGPHMSDEQVVAVVNAVRKVA
ncbi:MAG: DegT/DnrJ/EryC1/StrS family aminotransferase [Rhodopirellula sp.]|nr:DegT/DnrJ/EryC1/StrS family aminotransferase [Rhodopirellula sp.]